MAVLSDNDILAGLREGNVVISPFIRSFLGNCSYDVTLGENYYRSTISSEAPDAFYYNPWSESATMRYWGTFEQANEATTENAGIYGLRVGQKYIPISPGETILCHTQEFIGGRYNVTTMMKARSSLGRSGISVCKCAGYGDIGYINRWTMEVTNMSAATIILPVGYRVAQIVFIYAGVPSRPYAGKYQANTTLKEIQGRWHPSMMLPRLYEEADNIPVVGFSSEEESDTSCPNSSSEPSEESGESDHGRKREKEPERPREKERGREPERPREKELERPRENDREKEPERPRDKERGREPERPKGREPERPKEKERGREPERPREREREPERPREKERGRDPERQKERGRDPERPREPEKKKEPERQRSRPQDQRPPERRRSISPHGPRHEKESAPPKSTSKSPRGEKKEPYWCNKCRKYHHLDNKAPPKGPVRDLHHSIDEPVRPHRSSRPSGHRRSSPDPNRPNGLLAEHPSGPPGPIIPKTPSGVSFVQSGPTIISPPKESSGQSHDEVKMDLDELKRLLQETGAMSAPSTINYQ